MDTFERVRQIVATMLHIPEERITLQTKLTEDLGADSLDLVEIAMALEDAFGIKLDEEVPTIITVQQIVGSIEAQAGCLR